MLDQWSVLSSFLGFLLGCPNSKLLVVLESSMVTDVQIDVFFSSGHFFFKLCLTNGQFWAYFAKFVQIRKFWQFWNRQWSLIWELIFIFQVVTFFLNYAWPMVSFELILLSLSKFENFDSFGNVNGQNWTNTIHYNTINILILNSSSLII